MSWMNDRRRNGLKLQERMRARKQWYIANKPYIDGQIANAEGSMSMSNAHTSHIQTSSTNAKRTFMSFPVEPIDYIFMMNVYVTGCFARHIAKLTSTYAFREQCDIDTNAINPHEDSDLYSFDDGTNEPDPDMLDCCRAKMAEVCSIIYPGHLVNIN